MIIPFIATDLREVSPLVLAYIGDSVFELYARCHVATRGAGNSNKMHKQTIGYVSAESQAKIIRTFLENDILNETEVAYFTRGKNSDPHSQSKNASPVDYLYATGFESLIGYLFLDNQSERLEYLVAKGFDILDNKAEEK